MLSSLARARVRADAGAAAQWRPHGEEVHALLSRAGLELLHDIDTVFEEVDPFRERDAELTLLLPETVQPYHVLRNFVVWRRAAVVCTVDPLYSPALIQLCPPCGIF